MPPVGQVDKHVLQRGVGNDPVGDSMRNLQPLHGPEQGRERSTRDGNVHVVHGPDRVAQVGGARDHLGNGLYRASDLLLGAVGVLKRKRQVHPVRKLGRQVVGRAHTRQHALGHNHNPVTELRCLFHRVGGQNDRGVPRPAGVADDGPDLATRPRIQPGRRLVQKDDRRRAHERHPDRDPPLHPSAERTHRAGPSMRQVQRLQRRRHLFLQP